MANRTLNTRIKLRYDNYQNWYNKNPELLAGELAIAYIESGDTQEVNSVAAPQVLFKVGPGYFNDLPWASGKAADVYSWAKAAVKPSYTKAEVGLGNVRDVEQYSKDEVDELVEGIREDLETDTNTTYRFAVEKNKIVFYSTEKGGSESQVAAFEVDLSDVENAISNCYTKNEIDNKGFLVASDIAGKAEKTYVDEELAKKANLTYVNEELAKKADKTDLDNYYNKDSIDGVVNGLDQRITTNANAIEALTNGTSTEEIDSVMELVKYVNEHGAEVTGIKADIKANTDAIVNLQSVDTGLNDRLAVVEDTLGLGGEFIGTEYNKGSGMLQPAYFNTDLSYEETVQILSEVLPLEDGINSAREYLLFSMAYDKVCVDITRSEDTGKVDYLIWSDTNLNVGNRRDYWFSTYASDDYNIGWNKTAENPITYTKPTAIWRNEADDYVYGNLPVGTHNSELTKIFSSTPFQFQPSELAVYTKSEVDELVNVKANSADVYTKGEVDGLVSPVSEKVATLESGLATEKGRIDTIAADYLTSEDKTNLENGLGGLIENEKERAEGEELKLSNRIKNVEDNYLSSTDVIIWDCGGAN